MPNRETLLIDNQTAWATGPGISAKHTTATRFDDPEMLTGDPVKRRRISQESMSRLFVVLQGPQHGNYVDPISYIDQWGEEEPEEVHQPLAA